MAFTTGEARGRAPPDMRPVVLVTGGSRGIGLALARGFAARGHDLFLIARDAERLHEAAAAITAEFGVWVGLAPCDLARRGAAAGLLAALDAARCTVDVLVNCAGVAALGSFIDNDAAAARAMRNLNIEAATDLMHACLPAMVARRRGGILTVASLAGVTPMPYLALYGATKSYLVALSRAVATEVAGTGVTVSVLLPGPVDTGFFANSMQASGRRTAPLSGAVARGRRPHRHRRVSRRADRDHAGASRVAVSARLEDAAVPGAGAVRRARAAGLVGYGVDGSGKRPFPCTARSNRTAHDLCEQRCDCGGSSELTATSWCLRWLPSSSCCRSALCRARSRTPMAPSSALLLSLLDYGIHANAPEPGSTAKPAPSRSMAPGYPALVAAVAALDHAWRRAFAASPPARPIASSAIRCARCSS